MVMIAPHKPVKDNRFNSYGRLGKNLTLSIIKVRDDIPRRMKKKIVLNEISVKLLAADSLISLLVKFVVIKAVTAPILIRYRMIYNSIRTLGLKIYSLVKRAIFKIEANKMRVRTSG